MGGGTFVHMLCNSHYCHGFSNCCYSLLLLYSAVVCFDLCGVEEQKGSAKTTYDRFHPKVSPTTATFIKLHIRH